MNESQFPRFRARLVLGTTLAVWALLAWRHVHGGVPVHHVLRRGDLPGISCWWDGILAPALAWFLAGRARKRLAASGSGLRATDPVVLGWAGGLGFGLALGWAALHAPPVAAQAPLVLLLLALLLPTYRAECVLGFVLGMTPAVGTVLPLVFATLMAAAGAAVHLGARAVVALAVRWYRGAGK
jgi:hypothetical protein